MSTPEHVEVIPRYPVLNNPERFVNDVTPAIRLIQPDNDRIIRVLDGLVAFATDNQDWAKWRFDDDRPHEQRVLTPTFDAAPFEQDPPLDTRLQVLLPTESDGSIVTIEKTSREDETTIYQGQYMFWYPGQSDPHFKMYIRTQRARTIDITEDLGAHREHWQNAFETVTAAVAKFCPLPDHSE